MLVRKQKTYQILDADDDDDDDNGGGSIADNKSSTAGGSDARRADMHKKRFRKQIGSEEDEDNEAECLYYY